MKGYFILAVLFIPGLLRAQSQPALDISGVWCGTGQLRDGAGDVHPYTAVAVNSFLDPNTEQFLETYVWEEPAMENACPYGNDHKWVLRFNGPDFTIDPSAAETECPSFTQAVGHCYFAGDILPANKNYCHHLRSMPDGSLFQALIIKEDADHVSVVRMQSKDGALISTMQSTYFRASSPEQCPASPKIDAGRSN